ncbi:MAG TPA: Fur family transcriptional regulator [Blastocatellia bacterium]|nr:Fur family transcriptional regulator [Blastocatellia bacterium]
MVESRGLKMTPQRRAIVEFLQSATNHPTAEEVLKAVNEKFPMTSRATVYNTLNWLKGEGMIREVFQDEVVRFDPNTSNHHHFICRKCNKVEDVEGELISNFRIDPLPGNQVVENFEVTLRGLCLDCRGS